MFSNIPFDVEKVIFHARCGCAKCAARIEEAFRRQSSAAWLENEKMKADAAAKEKASWAWLDAWVEETVEAMERAARGGSDVNKQEAPKCLYCQIARIREAEGLNEQEGRAVLGLPLQRKP